MPCPHRRGFEQKLTYSADGWVGFPLSVRLTCRACGETADFDGRPTPVSASAKEAEDG